MHARKVELRGLQWCELGNSVDILNNYRWAKKYLNRAVTSYTYSKLTCVVISRHNCEFHFGPVAKRSRPAARSRSAGNGPSPALSPPQPWLVGASAPAQPRFPSPSAVARERCRQKGSKKRNTDTADAAAPGGITVELIVGEKDAQNLDFYAMVQASIEINAKEIKDIKDKLLGVTAKYPSIQDETP